LVDVHHLSSGSLRINPPPLASTAGLHHWRDARQGQHIRGKGVFIPVLEILNQWFGLQNRWAMIKIYRRCGGIANDLASLQKISRKCASMVSFLFEPKKPLMLRWKILIRT
jgi:hypothetical protein